MKSKLIVLNLTAIFAVAFALTTFLHEFAHAIMAKMVNVDPVLFHSYVSYDSSTTPASHQLYIAAAGPLFSLLQALVFLKLLQTPLKIDFTRMLYLWMAILGMVVFLGYVMMGPFVPYGDSGKIYAILGFPDYISYSLTAFALIIIIWFFRKVTPQMGNFMSQLKIETGYDSNQTVYLFFVLPVLIGTVINVMISLPAPTLMSLAFPVVISLTMIPSAIRLYKSNLSSSEGSSENDFSKRVYWPILALILLIIISRILVNGIAL